MSLAKHLIQGIDPFHFFIYIYIYLYIYIYIYSILIVQVPSNNILLYQISSVSSHLPSHTSHFYLSLFINSPLQARAPATKTISQQFTQCAGEEEEMKKFYLNFSSSLSVSQSIFFFFFFFFSL